MSTSLASQPKTFVLDFDGTITVKDTIEVLGRVGVEWQEKRGRDVKKTWDRLVMAYGRDFEEHVGAWRPVKEERRTVDEEVMYLRGLKDVEERSFGRVSESGLFEGMKREDWVDAGRRAVERGDVVVRKGCEEFIRRLRGEGMRWGIVSVNFSSSFIRGVLGASAGFGSEEVEVLANEVGQDGLLVGPRKEDERVIATSDAKLASMGYLLSSWSVGRVSEASRVVYVGDSGTDLECLLGQDVIGIVISNDDQSSLIQTLRRIQVEVVRITAYEEQEAKRKRIYFARNFDEIVVSLLRVST